MKKTQTTRSGFVVDEAAFALIVTKGRKAAIVFAKASPHTRTVVSKQEARRWKVGKSLDTGTTVTIQ